ncbi:MAG: hypothetical protein Q4D02_04115 [Clostridia bacterium]|nr:hypothetical protein [Clostridia bacterium]
MITEKQYPYRVLQYEWERLYPWVNKAFSELDHLFYLSSTEYEVFFDKFGVHICQRGKDSLFSFNSNLFPTIKQRHDEICKQIGPYVPETMSAKIKLICKHFGDIKDIPDLESIWLKGEKDFVIEYLYSIVDDNKKKQSQKKCDLMNHLLDMVEY